MNRRFVFIGAGNLATRLSIELARKGFEIEQVYSRTQLSAKTLADKLNTKYTTSVNEISADAGICFVALKDSAFDEVLPKINFQNRLVVHCAGSMPLSSIEKYSENTGVLYPLQTFSKDREVDFLEIPVFVEANTSENEKILLEIAGTVSNRVSVLNSEGRMSLHIAAVFACNFANHFYTIAAEILKSKDLSFEVLHHLILETALKAGEVAPADAQTGPAVRFDENVISKHFEFLNDLPEYRNLYEILSESIYKYHKNR